MPKRSIVESVLARIPAVGSKVIALFSGLLSATLILYSSYVLYDTFYTQNKAFASEWDLLQYRPEIINDSPTPLSGKDTLASINADYRAWLTMYETNIDYPVMQGLDDLYYAFHDVHKQSSVSGSIYLAAANGKDMKDAYNVIYGHHMDNKAMFGGLDDYLEESYFKTHKTGVLITKNKIYDLTAFAVLHTDAYENEVYGVTGRTVDQIRTFLENATDRGAASYTVYYDPAVANKANQVAALSTCAGATTNGRLVVFVRMEPRESKQDDDDDDDDDGGGGGGGGGGTGGGGSNPTSPDPGNQPTQPTGPAGPVPADGGSGSGIIDAGDGTGSQGGGGEGGGQSTIEPTADSGGGQSAQEPGGNGGEEIGGNDTPLSAFMQRFVPPGGFSINSMHVWALLNLICTLVTLYILIPLSHFKEKFTRSKLLHKIDTTQRELETLARLNAGESADDDTVNSFIEKFKREIARFIRNFRLGIGLEIIFGVAAVVIFIMVSNMNDPMVLIDQYTPLFLALAAASYLADVKLVRFKTDALREEAEELQEQLEGEKARLS